MKTIATAVMQRMQTVWLKVSNYARLKQHWIGYLMLWLVAMANLPWLIAIIIMAIACFVMMCLAIVIVDKIFD